MTATPPRVVPLFATPFGVVAVPGAEALNPVLASLLDARATEDRRDPASGCSRLAFRSRDDLLDWADAPVRQVVAGILEGVRAVVALLNEFSDAQFATLRLEARAWFTIVRPDGCIPATSFPNTAWCAVYCVATPGPSEARFDSGVLRMHEARLATFSDATNCATRIPYRPGHYTWRPVAGELAVFPASLTHEIALLRAASPLVLVTARVRFVAPGQTGLPWW